MSTSDFNFAAIAEVKAEIAYAERKIAELTKELARLENPWGMQPGETRNVTYVQADGTVISYTETLVTLASDEPGDTTFMEDPDYRF